MAKKRICLIGRELVPGTAAQGAYLPMEKLQEVLEWAERQAFDGVGVLSTGSGVLAPDEQLPEGEAGQLMAMGAKARCAWAGRVCDEAVERWGLDAEHGPSEIVLLAGLSGYQELAEALRSRLPWVTVTRPIAGTGIVDRSKMMLHDKRQVEPVNAG